MKALYPQHIIGQFSINNEYNLGFGSPRNDTCATCDKQDGDFTQHTERTNAAFTVQKTDRLSAGSSDGVYKVAQKSKLYICDHNSGKTHSI